MGGGIEALRRGGVTTSSKLPVAGKFNMARVALTLALFAGARGMSFSGGGDVELGCADSVLSFRLKGQSGCSALTGPAETRRKFSSQATTVALLLSRRPSATSGPPVANVI